MDDIRHCKAVFLELSHHAVRLGVLSPGTAKILQRAQTRKQQYWCSSLHRLVSTLEKRLSERWFDRRLDSLRDAVAEYSGSE